MDFQTSNRFYHNGKMNTNDPLGKRVIKSQSGVPIPLKDRDFDIMVDQGFVEPKQRNTDEQLSKLIDKNVHYSKDIPYSYWQEKVNSGAFYKSVSNNDAATSFNKNNKFLKEEFKNYTHTLG